MDASKYQDAAMRCPNCGGAVASEAEVIEAVRRDYDNVGDNDSLLSRVSVFHPDCAVTDGLIDSVDDLNGAPFYYELRG